MSALMGGIERPFSRLSDRAGGIGILGVLFANTPGTQTIKPPGDGWCFGEVLGAGGAGRRSAGSGISGSGGAGSDAIFEVRTSDSLSLVLPAPSVSNSGAEPTTISLNGSLVVSGPHGLDDGRETPGKYPGGSGSSSQSNSNISKGGGRLAGVGTVGGQLNVGPQGAGGGGGQLSTNGTMRGAVGSLMLTFFASRDEALAFANSIYGGAWSP